MVEIEKELNDIDIIVSSTDIKGKITYANKTFTRMCEYTLEELYGKPHNIIRHPDMPKAIFKFAWDNLKDKKPVIAYVKNYTKDKTKYYWVKALIVPVIKNNTIVQYTSYRTKPTRFAIEQISQIYKILLEYEQTHTIDQTLELLFDYLQQRNLTYQQFINKLNSDHQVLNDKLLSIDTTQLKIDHIIFKSNIQSLVQKNETNITVSQPCCCNFGKKLLSLEKETFANDEKFLDVKSIHEDIHYQMKVYIKANDLEQKLILNDVKSKVDHIFTILEDLINNYK